jgi:molybdenum cofactor cytidylyltransferase
MKQIAAIVLAAGQSRRMVNENKLLAEIGGKPMVVHAVEAACASRVDLVIVVTGHQGAAVAAALAGLGAAIVHNFDYEAGMSSSLKCGLAAVPHTADCAIICLGDMPMVTSSHIDRLIDAFDPDSNRSICIPTHQGRRGNPVLWAQHFFTEMEALSGDAGARRLIGEHEDDVLEVAMDDDAVLTDIDTPERLSEINSAAQRAKLKS